ncbi:uncharacterized protein N7458_000179 [Penicillium daleae]|uniref:Uncharacterized protein n=1 Tax=Penicillium daleae TaxID=63821 RepID=A0AAD6CFN8_9EURO|nr:uncharacterized protein N7458_000179 [Penicillium daleae]KAJ5464493.1 hypothetical protein N7458_000179 [Penicillium daleae]
MVAYELKNQASVISGGETRSGMSIQDRDNAHLRRMGKKPVLKRNFGILSILGFSCTVLGTWEGMLGTFLSPVTNGGPGGAVYGFIFAWVGTVCIFVVLSELASMAPTAGGQYHWAAMLAPIKFQKFLSYITGWFTIIGWQCGFAASAFLTGTMIQGTAVLAHSKYDALPWQGTLIVWLALLVALLVNLAGGKLLPRLEAVVLVVHVLGFFGIMIPLVYMSDHAATHDVFLSFQNDGEFATQGLSWFVGMTSLGFAFAGGDAAVHMAEEIVNAARVIPQALLLSVGINGCLGFGMLIAMLFCASDLKSALESPTGYPFMAIFFQATNSLPGTLAMISIVLVIYCCAIMGLLAAASRQLWSFARDRGVPGWRWWSNVSPSNQLPIYSVILSVAISTLLALINIGSSVALGDILSMAVSGLYLSYLTISVLLLFRRVRGDISLYNDNEDDIINVPGSKLVWGTFRCPGVFGTLVNLFAVIYITIIIFFSFWPSKMNPGVDGMNYSVVGIGGCTILATLYYFVRARKIYTGPIVETSDMSM